MTQLFQIRLCMAIAVRLEAIASTQLFQIRPCMILHDKDVTT